MRTRNPEHHAHLAFEAASALGRMLVLALAVSAAAARTAQAQSTADILYTAHNLSVTGTGSVRATSETRICVFCHTPKDEKQRPIAGQELSGGWVLTGPWGRVVSSNITPDPDTYLGKATRDEFIDRFKSLEHLAGDNAPVAPPGKNTVMAWPMFGGMTREDLGAIYDYLRTLKPISNKVPAPLPPKEIK